MSLFLRFPPSSDRRGSDGLVCRMRTAAFWLNSSEAKIVPRGTISPVTKGNAQRPWICNPAAFLTVAIPCPSESSSELRE